MASRTHVAHMKHGDFYHGEKSITNDKAREVRMELVTKSGETIVLKPKVKLRLSQVNRCGKLYYFGVLHYTLYGHIPTGFRRQGTLSMAPAGEGDTDAC